MVTGFLGLTITSLVWVGCGLIIVIFINFFRRCDDRIDEKPKGLQGKVIIKFQYKKMDDEKGMLMLRHASSRPTPHSKNPLNPVNPDSKSVTGQGVYL